MGKILGGIFGGGGSDKKPVPVPQAKIADPNPRRDINQSTVDANTAAQRAAARRKRVSNQVQVGPTGARAGLKTALSSKPTRSGVSIS